MKKLNLLKLLILVVSVLFSTQKAFCEATAVQMLETSVQPTVAIEKTSSNTEGSINPKTGDLTSELTSTFNLQINDTKNYDFVIYSTVNSASGAESAFDINGNLLFANTTVLPLTSAVSNARQNVKGNPNVIVYPFKLSIDTDMTKTFSTREGYNECYQINFTNSAMEGEVTQTIGGSALPNTYSIGEDVAGIYKATVYITSVAK